MHRKLLSFILFACVGPAFSVPLTPLDRADVHVFTSLQRVEPPPKQIYMHRSPYKGCIDINYSPYAGGEDLLSATRIAEWVERFLLNTTPLCSSKSFYARTWRLSEMALVWLPLNYFAMVVQHEVFGHGYRIRDINHGTSVAGYTLETPPPFGSGGGATMFKVGDNLTMTEYNTICSAGVESTEIMAQLTKLKWLEAGFIDPRQTVLYILGQQDLTLYIGTLKALDEDEDLSGHDIHDYIQSLNLTYTQSTLTKGRLLNLNWVNLCDPFTLYSIYSWFHYISSGKESKILMIPMWGARYLPGLRLGLSPFGPEFFLDNYLVRGNTPYYFYVKGGEHAGNTYVGLGLYAPRIFHIKKWAFGLRFDAWRQPQLLLSPGKVPLEEIDFDAEPDKENPLYSSAQQHQMKIGAAASGIVFYRASPRYGGELELGYKSVGFLPGYALRTSPVARFSMVLVF